MEGAEIDRELQAKLDRGERLLWRGVPRQGLMLRAADAFAIPFSVVWCGFAIVWEASALRMGRAPGFFPLFGAAFVALGFYFVFGRFLVDAWARSRTIYAVTDQRVIIVSGIMQRQNCSLMLDGLGEITLSEDRRGRGTLTFGRDPSGRWYRWGMMGVPWGAQSAPAFEGVEESNAVFHLIRDAQRAARRARGHGVGRMAAGVPRAYTRR